MRGIIKLGYLVEVVTSRPESNKLNPCCSLMLQTDNFNARPYGINAIHVGRIGST